VAHGSLSRTWRAERQLNMNKDIGAAAGYNSAADSDVQLAAEQQPASAAEGLRLRRMAPMKPRAGATETALR
jgi:hypothetical protein